MRKVTLLLAVLMTLLMYGFAQSAEDAQYKLALEHYNNGNFNKTVEILEKYVRQNPKPEAYFLIAYSLYKLNQHEKANEYFNALFLIEPEYSPTPALIKEGKWPPEGIIKDTTVKLEKHAEKPVMVEPVEEEPTAATPPPAVAPSPPVAKAPPAVAPSASVAKAPPAVAPSAPVAKAPPAVAPSAPVEKAPPAVAPSAPVAKAPPAVAPSAPVEKAAPKPSFPSVLPFQEFLVLPVDIDPIIVLAVLGGLYIIFICLPLFLIARKLSVPGAWTALVPIIFTQIWVFVKSADKSFFWVLLMLVPIINIIPGIYLWMCIADNLGKNKLLGLLILLPVINLLFPFYLAFSKFEGAPERAMPEDFGLDSEPELDIGDTSFLDEEEPEPFAEEPTPAGEEPSFFEEEPESPAEEPASEWGEEEPEQSIEDTPPSKEAPAGWGGESDEEPAAWGESDEEQSEDDSLAWGEDEPK